MSNTIKRLIATVLFVVGGAVFIVFGCVSLKEIRNFTPIPAVVSHVTREWTPNGDGTDTEDISIFVTYTVDGQEYTEELQNTKTSYKQGDEITVLCNPEDPTQVSGATKGLAAIQIGAGALFALGGILAFVKGIIKGR